MANEEQLAILSQGVEVWNKWRLDNPNIDVDLSGFSFNPVFGGADLKGIDLRGCDLREVRFINADLRNADLSGSLLEKANFRWAKLNGVNFSFAGDSKDLATSRR
jgi:uncharacterized protein YjbI with pentapeptide repeats